MKKRGIIKLYMKKVLFLTIYFTEYVDSIKSKIESQMNTKVDVIFVNIKGWEQYGVSNASRPGNS